MPLLNFNYTKKRFQKPQENEVSAAASSDVVNLNFDARSETLFIKGINAAIASSQGAAAVAKVLPLQGILNLTTGKIFIAALTPRDDKAVYFNEAPLLEHKAPGLFKSGQYSPRIRSYQEKYSEGPTAHQQLFFIAANKPQVSADDANNMRGISINIQVTDDNVAIEIDGKSLSINETAQYLRTEHKPGHELSAAEAKNEVLKAKKVFSDECESWLYDAIVEACQDAIQRSPELSPENDEDLVGVSTVSMPDGLDDDELAISTVSRFDFIDDSPSTVSTDFDISAALNTFGILSPKSNLQPNPELAQAHSSITPKQ